MEVKKRELVVGLKVGLQVGLKALMGIVFVGWIMIWIMLPTNVYQKRWSPKIGLKTTTTYFRTLGKNLVMLGCPIFLIAVLGCFYLHLQRQDNGIQSSTEKRKKWKPLAFLKRPLLVRGPLGIVTTIELAFFAMFVALVIWSFAMFLHLRFPTITEESAMEEGHRVWELKLEWTALTLGLVGNLCLAFLFFPVTRTSSLLPLVGLTSESTIRYHVWVGHITMVLFTAHGFLYLVYWGSVDTMDEVIKWAKFDASNVAGELSLLAGLAMWVTTIPYIRRKLFEVFFYTHQLYLLFLLFFALHVGMGHFFWALPGVYLFLLDRYLRFLQSMDNTSLVSARVLPSAYELTFAKSPGCDYNVLSTIFVNVPSVSKLQWHPFTVSSSSRLEPDRMSIVIKKEGKWTQKLHDLLSRNPSLARLQVSVEGPYGPNTSEFLTYDSLVLVSGGSGITPFIGMIRELLHIATEYPDHRRQIPDIHLISAFKTSADLAMLNLILPASGNHSSDLSRLNLQIDAFVTRETVPNTEGKNQVRTIWFKPSAADKPISPFLGRNGWLCLAAVITASMVAFLLLLGITTRYYFYPREYNVAGDHGGHGGPKSTLSNSSRWSLLLFLMCASIILVAGLSVILIKKLARREIQVKNVDGPTPGASPGGTWVDKAGTELESLPNESVTGLAIIHYGTRPNLKKMLLESNPKLSTGVFVSGPSTMRREVATVCGSGLADNLHFESVSFSW